MNEHRTLEARLTAGELDGTLLRLYGAPRLEAARARCAGVLDRYAKTFGSRPEALFSAPGRTELGGNHTDHPHGRVLAAAVDLDVLASGSSPRGIPSWWWTWRSCPPGRRRPTPPRP